MSPIKYLEFLLSGIVQHPECIEISEKEDNLWILLFLRVHSEDMGVVIGKSWKTIDALRILLHVFSGKSGKKIALRLSEEENP